jgi:D-sedoheptulose 7-phosphate isomerase
MNAAGDLASLYPFFYARDSSGRAELLAEFESSNRRKAEEILTLREQLLRDFAPSLAVCAAAVADRLTRSGRLLTFGNGGSSTDAQAVAQIFSEPSSGEALPAISLCADVAALTALANDVSFDMVFARQIAALGRPADVALGLSTSGGSVNVLKAFDEASRRGLLTIGFAGYDGGRMAESSTIDFLFVVPSSSVHRIQEAQTTLYQALWRLTQAAATSPAPRHITVG